VRTKIAENRIIFSCVIAVLAAVLGLYGFAALSGSEIFSSIMSLVSAAAAGVVFTAAGLKAGTGSRMGLLFYASAAASFSWVIADIIWIADLGRGADPTENLAAAFWYLMPDAVFGMAVLVFALRQNSRWQSAKSIFEAVTVALISVVSIWFIEFDGEHTAFFALGSSGLLTLILVFIDVYMLVQLVLLLFAVEKKSLPPSLLLFGAGVFVYALTDLICYLCGYNGVYNALFTLGGFYVASFSIAAAGAIQHVLFQKTPVRIAYHNLRTKRHLEYRWLSLAVFPITVMLKRGFLVADLFIFGFIFGLFLIALYFINQSGQMEELYRAEKETAARTTRRLEELQTELSTLQSCDAATKLYNRRYFTACVDKAVRLLSHNEIVAVLQFDVDRFKTINGTYGHVYGDKVIAEIAGRLQNWNRCGAVLCRLGGDEFAVMLRGLYSRYDIGEFCKQILSVCNAPIFLDTQVLYLTVSAGISLCPNDAGDSITLLKNSDISMHKAKAEGYNKYVFYTPAFKENIHRNNEIEALLRKADPDKDFELVFQPQFDLPDRRLLGAEALLRWKSTEHGYIPPSVFVPVAEEINLIGRIGAWVLAKAIEQIIRWNKAYGLEMKMGVNISPKQLSEKSFFATMKSLIGESGVNPAWLDAEITENLMIEEKMKVKPIFTLFEELGISVSIDDFGSGYSSLGYLNKFHFDRIKIDKSLIDNLLVPGGSGVEIVRAIVNMAEAVGKLTIAEGVERPEQLKILEELGCRQVQGYLFGKPVSADEFCEKYIKGGGRDRV
jgi:diguanylate cyclase (GGDEF)-like protein